MIPVGPVVVAVLPALQEIVIPEIVQVVTVLQTGPISNEPVEAQPSEAEPRTFRKETPPVDDFEATKPREADDVIPNPNGFRRPAAAEPTDSGNDIIPQQFELNRPSTLVEPVDVDSTVVSSFQPGRRRIVMNASYKIPTVARVKVSPEDSGQQTRIAATK